MWQARGTTDLLENVKICRDVKRLMEGGEIIMTFAGGRFWDNKWIS
jgi:hypothetical protein